MSQIVMKAFFEIPEGAENLEYNPGKDTRVNIHDCYHSIEYFKASLSYTFRGVYHFLLCSSDHLYDDNGEVFYYISPRY